MQEAFGTLRAASPFALSAGVGSFAQLRIAQGRAPVADTDSFIEEVTEEVRQDRMFGLWKRYGPYVLAGVFLIVAAAAGWQWRVNEQRLAAREAGGVLNAAAQVQDAAARAAAFAEAAPQVGDAALLAKFGEAAAAAEAGDAARAQTIYAAIAADQSQPKRWSQLADLKSAALSLNTGESGTAMTTLAPLTAEGEPYRLLAIELQGVAQVMSGDLEAARTSFETVLNDPAATATLQGRAAEFLRSIGVEPE